MFSGTMNAPIGVPGLVPLALPATDVRPGPRSRRPRSGRALCAPPAASEILAGMPVSEPMRTLNIAWEA